MMFASTEEQMEFQNKSRAHKYRWLGLYALLGYISTQLHEVGHWSVATILGLRFALGFNRWQIISESTISQKLAVLSAGPVTTLALVVTGLLISYYIKNVFLRMVGLLIALFNSLFALIPQLLSTLTGGMGDMGWIAFYLGVPQYVIRFPLVLALTTAMIAGFRRLGQEMRATKWMITGLLLMPLLIGGLVFSLDKFVWRSYEDGALLLPAWGISAITLLVNNSLLAVFFVILWKGAKR